MSDNVIIQAILEIAESIEAAKEANEASERRQNRIESAVSIGYPVGTTLYKFDYEDGLDSHKVTGEKHFGDYGVQWCQPEDLELLATTPEGAVDRALASWLTDDDFDIDADIASMEWNVKYHQEKVDAFSMMRDALLGLKGATQ